MEGEIAQTKIENLNWGFVQSHKTQKCDNGLSFGDLILCIKQNKI